LKSEGGSRYNAEGEGTCEPQKTYDSQTNSPTCRITRGRSLQGGGETYKRAPNRGGGGTGGATGWSKHCGKESSKRSSSPKGSARLLERTPGICGGGGGKRFMYPILSNREGLKRSIKKKTQQKGEGGTGIGTGGGGRVTNQQVTSLYFRSSLGQ